jgi:hypothetical protein
MSGGWTANDRVIVRDNIIGGNNYLQAASFRVGIGISTANERHLAGTVSHEHTTGVSIIFTASRTRPQPDARGVAVQSNVKL